MSINNEGELSVPNNEGEPSVPDQMGAEHALAPRDSRTWIGAAAAVAVIAAVAVGGVTLVNVLGGGGAQPEDVFPANAIVFAKVDLNPSAGQKLAVYQLARKFPTSRDKVTSEESSIKESTFGSSFTGDSGWGLDYKKDVEPWLGDRVGVGVFPDMDSDKQPEVGFAIAVTDQDAAKIALDKAVANAAKGNEKVGYAFADGFVIVSDTTAHAASLVRVGKVTPLTGSAYVADVQKLGSEQIGVVWVDVAASYKAVAQGPMYQDTLGLLEGAADPKNMSGRLVVGLHADPSFIEMSGKAIDLKGVDALTKGDSATGPGLIASFPADVLGAVSSTGLGKAVGALYPSLTASNDSMQIKPMLDALGIDSATQIETLLGDATGVVVGGTLDQPVFAVRTATGSVAAAYALAGRILSLTGSDTAGASVHKVQGPDGILVGTGSGLIGAITSQSGSKLGSTATFTQVMQGVGQADFAVYLNLAKLMPRLTSGNSGDAASLEPLKALGLTATRGAEPAFRLRLSVT